MMSPAEHYKTDTHQKLEIILRGVNINNEKILSTNITLTKEVQNFILSTKRFTAMEDDP